MNDLKKIAEEIKTQDNMATADPIFILFDHEKVPTDSDYSDEILYCYNGSGDHCEIGTTKEEVLEFCKDNDIALPEDIDKYDIAFEDFIDETEGLFKIHYLKKRVYQQCFFTKKSAEQYLKSNKHHFKDPLIWCDTLYRNYEMQAIRNALIHGEFWDGDDKRIKKLETTNDFWMKRSGDTNLGVSAHALLKYVSGYTDKPTAHPHDDSDWRRCVSAICTIPFISWLNKLGELSEYGGWKEYKKELVEIATERINVLRKKGEA